ncbi:hypothetical protein HELRODRAFT_164051 [Helobdella robusta]|uniref:Uncharacterized protein n=1 Tax=Helobdella robusta TaxID=6412 RepID=T1EUU1_HELRO|nr:hypothetical protein HELRODRAFT_164051 [Helobdella robusta]ESN94246.1 hypothetical protein HELRODRAFT_164051 [Helobdella robusta]
MTNKEGQKKNEKPATTQQTTNKLEKKAMKIIGKKVSNDCKLKADKILMKKFVFCLSNVSKCHRNDVMAYLTDNGIHVVSCYSVLKQFNKMAPASTADVNNNNNSQTENKKTDEEEYSTFRLCIDRSDSKKMKDPDIMPQHIIVSGWQFNKKPETIVDQKKMDKQHVDNDDDSSDDEEKDNLNPKQTTCKRYDNFKSLNDEYKLINKDFDSSMFFNVMHLNIRSLVNKTDELESYLSNSHIKFNVVAITESWLNERTESLVGMDEYRYVGKNRHDKHGGGLSTSNIRN